MSFGIILLPLFVQVLLMFVLLFWLADLRRSAVKRGELSFQDAAIGNPWTGRAAQVSNAFRNQFELPVLFFVVVILAMFTRKADFLFLVLEWIFVALRIAHAAIHTGPNVVRVRGPVWGLGALVLLIMWIWFAAHIYVGF
jgi:hypothetical protein